MTHSYCVFLDKTGLVFWDIKKSKKCVKVFRKKIIFIFVHRDVFLTLTGTVSQFALVYLSCSCLFFIFILL